MHCSLLLLIPVTSNLDCLNMLQHLPFTQYPYFYKCLLAYSLLHCTTGLKCPFVSYLPNWFLYILQDSMKITYSVRLSPKTLEEYQLLILVYCTVSFIYDYLNSYNVVIINLSLSLNSASWIPLLKWDCVYLLVVPGTSNTFFLCSLVDVNNSD